MKTRILDMASFVVLCVILSLGLWPFHSPANTVAWMPGRNGLEFPKYSTVLSARPFPTTTAQSTSSSIEVWLQPSNPWLSATLLAFPSFSLRQSRTDLELIAANAAPVYVNKVFRRKGPIFVAISSGPSETAVYLDGLLARLIPQVHITSREFSGQLVLGDSPGQPDNWAGRIMGLAIYPSQLTPEQVLQHYQTWTNDVPAIAFYPFTERVGNLIHDQSGAGLDLYIPEKYKVLDKIFLEPFWTEFRMNRSNWRDILKNVVGFIPLGACFWACLAAHKVSRAALVTVLLGFLVSLTIEVLQAYLPTRDSGTTDLITNTLGTYIGVIFAKRVTSSYHWEF